ncbi:MAG: hypothetical protein V8Q42_04635, partial [Anaerovoracaceae bacterium]
AGHDLKNDYFMLMSRGLTDFETDFDTAVAQYVIDPGRNSYSLPALSNEYLLYSSLKEEKDFLADNSQVDLFTDTVKAYMDYGFEVCSAVLNSAQAAKGDTAEGIAEKRSI